MVRTKCQKKSVHILACCMLYLLAYSCILHVVAIHWYMNDDTLFVVCTHYCCVVVVTAIDGGIIS
jgi:hypothetical protein